MPRRNADARQFFDESADCLRMDNGRILYAKIRKFGETEIATYSDKRGRNVLMVAIENNASDCCSTLLGTRCARQLCTRVDRNNRTALHYAYLTDAKSKIGRGKDLDAGIIPMIEAYSNQDMQDRKEMYTEAMKMALKKRNLRTANHNEHSLGQRVSHFFGFASGPRKRKGEGLDDDEEEDCEDEEQAHQDNDSTIDDDALEYEYHHTVSPRDAVSSPRSHYSRSVSSSNMTEADEANHNEENQINPHHHHHTSKPKSPRSPHAKHAIFFSRQSSLNHIGSSAATHHPHHHHHHLRHKFRHQKSSQEDDDDDDDAAAADQDPPLPPPSGEYIPHADQEEHSCSDLYTFSSLANLLGCGKSTEPKYGDCDDYYT